MTQTSNLAVDLRGYARLAVDATTGITDLVESMHERFGAPAPARWIAGSVYRSIRGVTRLVGSGLDEVLERLTGALGDRAVSAEREAMVAALNGLVGDHLVASGNPLAVSMAIHPRGRVQKLDRQPTGRLLLMVHGLCRSDLQWNRNGHDHGAVLARDLGYDALYLHYNSGVRVAVNGRELAERLEAAVEQWPRPVEELAVLAHSMGGLVMRSACAHGEALGHRWRRQLQRMVFLGTPHHGAPLERAGRQLEVLLAAMPYAGPLAGLGSMRSAGLTDLRHGSVIDEGPETRQRLPRPVPLPRAVRCYAIAGTVAESPTAIEERLWGDGLVPVDSALGRHADPARDLGIPRTRQWVARGVGHLDLLGDAAVFARIKQWFGA
ncbi:MAG: alpha/beta hydrolase [Acidobacteriota bacterium]